MRRTFYRFFLSSPPLAPFSTRIHILPSPKIRSGFLFPVWLSRLSARRGDAFIFCSHHISFLNSSFASQNHTKFVLWTECALMQRLCECEWAHIEHFYEKKLFLHCFFLLFCVHIWRSTTEKRQRRLVSLCGDFLKFLALLLCTQKKKKKLEIRTIATRIVRFGTQNFRVHFFRAECERMLKWAWGEMQGTSHTYMWTGGRLRTRTDCFVLTNQNEIRCIGVIELSRMRVTPFIWNGMKLDRWNQARRRWERIFKMREYRKEHCQRLCDCKTRYGINCPSQQCQVRASIIPTVEQQIEQNACSVERRFSLNRRVLCPVAQEKTFTLCTKVQRKKQTYIPCASVCVSRARDKQISI